MRILVALLLLANLALAGYLWLDRASGGEGMRLMLQSLAENTAALKSAPGAFREFPDNTADALTTGAMQAICGAVEQMRRQIDTNPAQVRVYLAGGAAVELAPHLSPPVEVVDNLVLEGVLALAGVAAPV